MPTRNQSGFSLIEILVAIALLSIMSGIGVSLYAIINNAYSRAHTISTIQTRGSSAMEVVERSIRSSTKAVTPATCSGTSCLLLTISANSSVYKDYNIRPSATPTNCTKMRYVFTSESQGNNGTLVRQWLDDNENSCGPTSEASINLFSIGNTPTRDSINVRTLDGAPIFVLNEPADGVKSVLIRLNLAQGGVSNAPSVPITTTVSLRPSGD